MKNIIILFIFCVPICLMAQKAKIKRAQNEFKKENYEYIIPLLLEILEHKDTSVAHHLLGVSLMNIDSTEWAFTHLKKAIQDKKYHSSSKYWDYFQCLLGLEKYGEALEFSKGINQSLWHPDYSSFLKSIVTQTDSVDLFQAYKIQNIKPKKKTKYPYQYINLVNNHAFLYHYRYFDETISYYPIQGNTINFKKRDDFECPEVDYPFCNPLWLTTNAASTQLAFSNNYYKYVCTMGDYQEPLPKIYIKIDSSTHKIVFEDVAFIAIDYVFLCPSFNAKGDTLYFSSNIPQGFGGMDLYYSVFNENTQKWRPPQNLGPQVNTPHDELYSFFHQKTHQLYFSTKGLPGYGGLDIFVFNPLKPYSKPFNLGKTTNSGRDDFAFSLSDSQQYGFFSSKKDGSLKLYQLKHTE